MPRKAIPRFVLSLVDTKTTIEGPKGKQYYSLNVGFSSKRKLLEPVSQHDGRSELVNVIDTFFETVEQMGPRKGGVTKGFQAHEREVSDETTNNDGV